MLKKCNRNKEDLVKHHHGEFDVDEKMKKIKKQEENINKTLRQ